MRTLYVASAVISLLCGFTAAKPSRDLLVQSFSASDRPVTVPFNSSLQPGAEDLPFDDYRVAKKVYGTAPEQVGVIFSPGRLIRADG
jgi:hypothetical protein